MQTMKSVKTNQSAKLASEDIPQKMVLQLQKKRYKYKDNLSDKYGNETIEYPSPLYSSNSLMTMGSTIAKASDKMKYGNKRLFDFDLMYDAIVGYRLSLNKKPDRKKKVVIL